MRVILGLLAGWCKIEQWAVPRPAASLLWKADSHEATQRQVSSDDLPAAAALIGPTITVASSGRCGRRLGDPKCLKLLRAELLLGLSSIEEKHLQYLMWPPA